MRSATIKPPKPRWPFRHCPKSRLWRPAARNPRPYCASERLLARAQSAPCFGAAARLRLEPLRGGDGMAQNRLIDLSSDTSTRPSPGMRKAMAQAEVGDEQIAADPSTNALQERVADLLGKEAAVFLPSGTMCNQIA